MPSGSPWVDLSDGMGNGNPTWHKSINKLIANIIQFKIQDEGAEGCDVRDMTIEEFQKEMELFREHKDPICRYRNTLMGHYQFQFITRCDDVCNFKVEDPRSHPNYDMAISQKVKWSKNVRDARNCPDQLLLASKEHKNCLFLALGLWLEHYLRIHPEATYMMTHGLPEGKTKKQHKKFTSAISKTYRNNWLKWVVKNESFKKIYHGKDKRPLGLHSKRKMGSTQAKRRGAGRDQINHRGRWVSKKGSKIVNQVYIDSEDIYADALCASVLALGGPIKYRRYLATIKDSTALGRVFNAQAPNNGRRGRKTCESGNVMSTGERFGSKTARSGVPSYARPFIRRSFGSNKTRKDGRRRTSTRSVRRLGW